MGCIAGIAGSFTEAEAAAIVERMLAAMKFRGSRDAVSSLLAGDPLAAFAGHRMHGDPRHGLAAVEGEIYAPGAGADNPGKLLQDLRLAKGDDFPRSVNGAYTAALWDPAEGTLLLVRDHVGCRSLFYAPLARGIVFASTAAAIVASGLVDDALEPEAVDAYFGVKALSAPRTLYRHIFALRPGNVLAWHGGALREHDYWRLHEIDADERTPPDELMAGLRATIASAVGLRQQAGGAYCALISGGIDSSAVATLLTTEAQGRGPLHGLSITFEEAAYSDAGLQDCLVHRLGIERRERILRAEDFARLLSEAVAFLDSPVNDTALVGMYAAFAMAREDGYDVVFDGEGPDELFPAGNTQGERGIAPLLRLPWPLRRALFACIASSLPLGDSGVNKIRRMCARLALPDDERRLTWRPLFHTEARRQLLHSDYHSGVDPYAVGKAYLKQCAQRDPLNLYQYGLIKTFLVDDLLYKNERMASAHKLMNRTPLVDYRLVELALRIPSMHQIDKPTPASDGIKLLYKAALRGIVADEILHRKKERGFSQPTRVWFSGPLREFVHESILGSRALARGFFKPAFLRRLLDEHLAGRANHDSFISSVLIFNLWMEARGR